MDTAVILAGGKGMRFGADTTDTPKPMAMLRGKPIISYIISMLNNLGFRKLYIIVGYKKEMIIDYIGTEKDGMQIEYINNDNVNSEKKCGLSDAVLLMKGIISSPFLTILGDEIYAGTNHRGMIDDFAANSCDASFAVHKTDDPSEIRKNYSVKLDKNGSVIDLKEKPVTPWNNLIGCGTYIFKPSVFDYIEKTPLSTRSGRKELADTMKVMISDGRKVSAFDIGGEYLNINYPQDMETAERIINGNNR